MHYRLTTLVHAPGCGTADGTYFMSAEKIFWPATVFLLTILLALQGISILQESQTYDEAVHLTAGFSYLTTGDYRLNPEHPPFSKMLAALPLLFLNPRLP